MARTTLMYANRKFTLRTTKGHVLHFERNKPKQVPNSVQDEALRVGVIPVEPDQIGNEEEKPPELPQTQSERNAAILVALEEMQAANDRSEFGANNMPTVKAIIARVGFKVDSTERDKLWEQLTATGDDADNAEAEG